MVRGILRVRYDRTAETTAIKAIMLASPVTGGRNRQRDSRVWDTKEEFEGDIVDFVDETLPENVPAP